MTTFVVTDTGGWTELGSGDLPASGVTPGTYGDATHVGQVTVNAAGVVTAASDVAITGGGGGGGYVVLFDSTLAVDTASIDTGAGGIAAGYNDLFVRALLRTTDAAAHGTVTFLLNNDSGANYDRQYWFGANTSTGAGILTADTGMNVVAHGSGGSALYASAFRLLIPAYTQTTFWRLLRIDQDLPDVTPANRQVEGDTFGYRSTAAISRMSVSAAAGQNLKAGSRLTVWGF